MLDLVVQIRVQDQVLGWVWDGLSVTKIDGVGIHLLKPWGNKSNQEVNFIYR